MDESLWHWGLGSRYAIEGMRALLWLSGAGLFLHRPYAAIAFVLAVLMHLTAYLSCLYRGNGALGVSRTCHNATYLLLALATLFVVLSGAYG